MAITERLQFIQVGELVKGISEDPLPADGRLTGTSLTLHTEDGTVLRLTFAAPERLLWQALDGPDAGAEGEEHVIITRPREEVAVVEYIASSRRATAVTVVLDLPQGVATVVTGTLPTIEAASRSAFDLATRGEELTLVDAAIAPAFIDRAWAPGKHPHLPTGDLVGKRVQYVYSRSEAYEHIYLTEDLYTWHCLRGSEQGLADTDRCHCRKIGDDLYLFVWREKIIPTLGVVLVDWHAMRSNGRLFGYEDADFARLSTTRISSRATLLNVTEYPGARA